MTTLQVNQVLECEGLACPMPVVRTKKTIDQMNAGEVLEVRATDKGSVADLKGWAKRTGHQYVGLKEAEGVFHHYIRKADDSEKKMENPFPHTLNNEQLQTKLNNGEAPNVLDVREPAEYAFGHIPGAISIPFGELEQRIGELDPDQTYNVVCRTGHRSDLACHVLAEQGFKQVRNIVPGMLEWTGATEATE